MMQRTPEIVLAGALIGTLLIGAAIDVVGDPVGGSDDAAVTGSRFVERAAYCAPALGPDNLRTQYVVGAASGEAASIDVVPALEQPVDLPAERSRAVATRAGPSQQVVGYGSPPAAGGATSFGGKVAGVAAASCAARASTRWYFAQGTSLLGRDERIAIYNPFPEDAVVDVNFYAGARLDSANTQDVAVPGGEWIVLRINRFIESERSLATIVTVERGRVVAWKALVAEPERQPEGAGLSLGATAPDDTWYFPMGGVGDGIEQTISILNPSSQEATVNIQLLTHNRAIQPPRLAEVKIGSETSVAFSLPASVSRRQADLGGAATVVLSTNRVPIVAERATFYSGSIEGFETEVGASRGATRWLLSRTSLDADVDRIAVFNPGVDPVTIAISLWRERAGPVRPGGMQEVTVKPGLRRVFDLSELPARGPALVVVDATRPVIVERQGYSAGNSDVSSLMGFPHDGRDAA